MHGRFAAGFGLAVFHTGVEQHWWLGTSGCAIQPLRGKTPQDLRAALLHTVSARCDEVTWTFLGLSMANWNVPLSLGLALFAGLAAREWIGPRAKFRIGRFRGKNYPAHTHAFPHYIPVKST